MSDEKFRWTQEELVAEARRRFPDLKPLYWRFECPNCGDQASAFDFQRAGVEPESVGQECIGRHVGALAKEAKGTDGQDHAKRGCDWTAYGLFRGPWLIVMPDGGEVGGFRLAPADTEAVQA